LETERFRLREVSAGDLDEICAVFASNPTFLALRDNAAAPSGGYDPATVKQYCEGALLDPARHLLVVTHKESGATVGLVDFIDESPADEMPWIGLVIIHRSYQRAGAGTSVVQAIAAHLESLSHRAVRMAVMEGNEAGLGFLRSIGCDEFASTSVSTAGEARKAVLFELALALPDSS
jgi:RimJ/RimL family protein N-acetyltransferase